MGSQKRVFKSIISLFLAILIMFMPLGDMTFNQEAEAATSFVTVRFHYSRTDSAYDSWYIWGWPQDGAGAWYAFSEKDENGNGVATVTKVSSDTQKFGFLVTTKDWTKDYGIDRYVNLSDVTAGIVDVYLNAGQADFTRNVSADAFVLSNARVTGTNKISVDWSSKQSAIPDINIYDVTENKARTDIANKTLNGDTGFDIIFTDKVSLGHEYKITYGTNNSTIAKVDYDSDFFESNYTYTGDDLGSSYSSAGTTFKVWAPTADAVSILLFDAGSIDKNSKYIGEYLMEGGSFDTKGVWSKTVTGDLKNKYYIYKVNIAGKTNYCMDPYSVTGCTINEDVLADTTQSIPVNQLSSGQRSMVTDLASTNPVGWETDKHVITDNKTDASVYEISIRDFSVDPDSGISAGNRMKYLAFTETGTTLRNEGKVSTGIDYIKKLGVSYIQIMPSFDFSGTNEVNGENYNWGYNPVNYNIPEGTFSTNPYDGNVRVNEYKQMVQAIHKQDMGVIMDVVYNHVNSDDTFCFNQLVPGYFFRGSNGSGCGNDVASERKMVRKYIVDSVKYWANEYHIDGFRFDLVGLLDVTTMNEVRAALNEINPDILVYGEGWSLSTSTFQSVDLATQPNTYKMPGVGMFNDVIRSAIRGGNDGTTRGYATGAFDNVDALKGSIMASNWFTNDPTQVINYISCHDNYTLWDKIQASTSWAWASTRTSMNKLAAAINITSQGIPLFQAGEEFLRTKGGDENSYKSSDAVNMMDWSLAEDNAAVVDYYAGLLKFRNNHAALRMTTRSEIDSKLSYLTTTDNVIAYTIDGSATGEIADKILVAFNPNLGSRTVNLPEGEWKVCVNREKAGTDAIETVSGSVEVTEYSAFILVQGATEEVVQPEKLKATLQLNKTECKVGDTVTLSASASGGSGSYTYKYVVHNIDTNTWYTLQNYGSNNSYTTKISSTGNKEFVVSVKDGKGTIVATNRAKVIVTGGALSATLKVNNSTSAITATVGSTIMLEPSAIGGNGNYTYKYVVHNLDTNVWYTLKDYSKSATYSTKISSAGNKEFVVSVKDGTGATVATNRIKVSANNETLKGDLKINNMTTSIKTSVGSILKLEVNASGGGGNYTYKYVVHNLNTNTWYTLKDYNSISTYTTKISSAGNKEFVVSIKDGNGNIIVTNKIYVSAS